MHPDFIHALRDEGRERAGRWLAQEFALVGSRSTFDMDAFLQWRESEPLRPRPAQASFAEGTS